MAPLFRPVTIEDPVTDPVMVVGLSGFVDAGGASQLATETLARQLTDARPVAVFDADELIDQRARRPVLSLSDGLHVDMAWGDPTVIAARTPGGQDVLMLTGPEPDYRWRAFASDVVDVALTHGCRLICSLGA